MYRCSIHNLPVFGKSLSLTFVLFIIPFQFCIFFSFVQPNTQQLSSISLAKETRFYKGTTADSLVIQTH